jgi:hypothetical protein
LNPLSFNVRERFCQGFRSQLEAAFTAKWADAVAERSTIAMKLIWNLIAVGTIATLATAQTPAQPVRVGTFHTQSVVVAFYRSPIWAERLKEKKAESEAAKKANDTKKLQELNEWGGASQELAHRQVAGDAPIANIIEALAPAFPEIAKKAQVSIIVQDLPYADSSVETVDVTDQLLDWLKADEAVRKIVRELRNSQGAPAQH